MNKNVKRRQIVESDGARVVTEDLNDDDDMEGYTPVPFEVIYEKHAVTREPCWGCIHTFRKPASPGEDPVMDHLWGVNERNVSSMSPKELARLIRVEWRRTVYVPLKEKGEECMEWPEHVIQRHIEGRHGLNKNAEITLSITTLSNIELEIRDSMFMQKDGVSGMRFDDKRVDSLCKIVALKQKLLAGMKD
jgi:hypothetical protein